MNQKVSRTIRHKRLRKKIFGTKDRPRLSVFRSNRYIYVQVIDDEARKTLAASNNLKIKKGSNKEKAKAVGEEIAKKCVAKKINQVVFDRGGYQYTGIIKVLAEAARKKGLKF